MRHGYSAWSNKIARPRKAGLAHIAYEIISEVGAVGEIKDLEDRLQVSPLANPEVLRHPCVELEERLPSEIAEVSV